MCFQSATTYTAVVSRHLISIVSLAVKDVAHLVETTLFVLYVCTKRTLCTLWLYKTTCIGRCSPITYAVDARMNIIASTAMVISEHRPTHVVSHPARDRTWYLVVSRQSRNALRYRSHCDSVIAGSHVAYY